MPDVKDDRILKLKMKLKHVTYKMRYYWWRWFSVKYIPKILKVLVSLLISILAELGVKYFDRD